jgi:DNA replication protein DnaC
VLAAARKCLKTTGLEMLAAVAGIGLVMVRPSRASLPPCLKREIRRYMKPDLLIVDELGYLPIDKLGADLLFQIISQRYERAPMVITTNRVYKYWSQIFNNDSTLTSAILDRVLHHVDTVTIEGKSFRTKKDIDE